MMNIMQVYKNGKYSKNNFLYSTPLVFKNSTTIQYILIIFVENVILLDKLKGTRVWEIAKDNIKKISLTYENE